ncbi:hypothetical protein ASD98_05900 [Flavobacterium sp. Root186]|nr:hypothetical protein ASD98_05900 [Flavobacterium sp. Root186]
MIAIGVIFLLIIISVFLSTNILFYRKLKNIDKVGLKHIILYFLFSVGSAFIIAILYYFFEKYILISLFGNEFHASITERIIKFIMLFSSFIYGSFYFSKFYINKLTKTNEIELIGKE